MIFSAKSFVKSLKIVVPYVVECLAIYKKELIKQDIFTSDEIEKFLVEFHKSMLTNK